MTISRPPGLALESIAELDPDLWAAMEGERHRQHDKIELIASENYVSAAVMEAQGSWLTNKYAEGLPGKRYYGGCEFVDVAERLAQERAIALFPGSEHVNVQPHSGAQANMAAYFSVLEPGDRIMGMNLAHGGHLTHGMALNFSGRLYEVHPYGVREDTERIDYDAMAATAREVRPKLIVGGASAYPRLWDFDRMASIAADVGALLFIDMAHIAGLVAAGVHPSPFPLADLVSTTTHKTLRGPRGGMTFSKNDLRPGLDPAAFPAIKNAEAPGALGASLDRNVFPGTQGGPLMHVIAGKALAFKLAAEPTFRADQQRTIDNARIMAETLAGLGARVVSGGTDNHLLLVDVTPLGVTGKDAEHLLDEIGITVNKNAIPFDKLPPNTASGIRIGTPATTSRRNSVATRCGPSAGSSSTPSASATTRPARNAWPPRSARSSIDSRCRGCPRGDRGDSDRATDTRHTHRAAMTFITGLGSAIGPIVVVFLAALALSFALTPLVRRVVLRYEIVDVPEARRVNTVTVPRGGGIAVSVAFLAVASVFLLLNQDAQWVPIPVTLDPSEVAGLLLGGAAAAGLGAIDDLFDLRARWQLLGQLGLAVFAVLMGISIGFVANPISGGIFPLSSYGPLAAGFTIFWIVGMINSINWIDGLDGLSSGIAFIAAVTLGIISLTTQVGQIGQPLIAVLCFALAGALLGFLRWNFYPATIFAGTSGVQFVGYTLAVLAILGTAKVAVALLVLGVPIIDTFWIIVRRISQRRSPFTPDRTHIHHRLLDLGLSHQQTVLAIYGICLVLAVLALLLSGVTQLYAFAGVFIAFGLVLFLPTRGDLNRPDELEAEEYDPRHVVQPGDIERARDRAPEHDPGPP